VHLGKTIFVLKVLPLTSRILNLLLLTGRGGRHESSTSHSSSNKSHKLSILHKYQLCNKRGQKIIRMQMLMTVGLTENELSPDAFVAKAA